MKIYAASILFFLGLLVSCSSDDDSGSSSSTSGVHSCDGEDPFVCTDLVAGAEIARALCQTTFNEGQPFPQLCASDPVFH